jgi:hypothetical protein
MTTIEGGGCGDLGTGLRGAGEGDAEGNKKKLSSAEWMLRGVNEGERYIDASFSSTLVRPSL